VWWRKLWDISFSVSSILSTFLIGVALGNLAWGVPIGMDKEFVGNFFTLIHPYSLLVGFLTVSLFMMHGSIYLLMKTEGDLHKQVKQWTKYTITAFIGFYGITTLVTLLYVPHMSLAMREEPIFFIMPLLGAFATGNIVREIGAGKNFNAFLSSCLAIIFLMGVFAFNAFPNLVYSTLNPDWSLTVFNAASSEKTLLIMLIIALIGMPLVLTYTASIYWIFRGKVELDETSY